MELFKEALLIKLSTPLYAIVIIAEIIFSFIHNRKIYTSKDTITNVYLTSLNFGLDIFMRTLCLFVLGYFFQFHVITFTNPLVYWVLLLIFLDFVYYWEHWVDHNCRLFWAVHFTHHSSEKFNLTTGFRSSVFQPLYRFFYFIPLSFLGFHALDIMFMYAATQIYGILIHTQYINKLGFLEYFMATPSHHRVHHANNLKYLDKNMGMVFIIWDKIFGTFEPEDKNEPVKFGLAHDNLNKDSLVDLVFHEWKNIFKDMSKSKKIRIKLAYLFNPPGWSHDGTSLTAKQLRGQNAQKTSQILKLTD